MFRDDLLRGRRILVTGGGTGLGRSMARRFLELGARVALCGRREEVLAEAKEEFDGAFAGRTAVHRCDVRDPEAVEAMLDRLWEDGGVDGLVNNAAGNFIARTETLSPRAVDAVVGIVLHGTAYATIGCGRRWLEAGARASVLSIVTSYAWTGSAYVVPSAMAKAGVLAMTRSLAVEWGPRGIRLNAVAPGPFPTEGAWERLMPNEEVARTFETRMPLGRPGEHGELADLAAYLVSDASSYVTGEVVTIDGGEWLGNAGQFNLLRELTGEDWEAYRRRARG